MRIQAQVALIFCLWLGLATAGLSQNGAAERLPAELLNIRAPSARIAGDPGNMQIQDRSCRTVAGSDLRARIVNAAVQEWAFLRIHRARLHQD